MIATEEQIQKWRGRDYSWSQHSSFLWNPREWFSKYVLDIPSQSTPELEFGKAFADACELRTPPAPVTMLAKMEQDFKVPFNGFTLIGYLDTFDDETFLHIGEYKTGMNPWTQDRVDKHGQLTFYCLMNWIKNQVRPEDVRIFLEYIPTQRVHIKERDPNGFDYKMDFATDHRTPHHFDTARTMVDVLKFGNDIMRVRADMEAFVAAQV